MATSNGPSVQASSGYAASAACACPGISISGMIVTWRASAYATMSRISSLCVEAPVPDAISVEFIETVADLRLLAERGDLGEPRVPLDLDAPSLVFGSDASGSD